MESQSIVILALLVGIFGATVWWHLRENRQLTEFLNRKKLDAATTDRLVRFAWSRSIQLFATAAFGIIIIVSYDWQFNETRNALVELSDAVEQHQASEEAQAKELAAKTTAPAPAVAVAVPAPVVATAVATPALTAALPPVAPATALPQMAIAPAPVALPPAPAVAMPAAPVTLTQPTPATVAPTEGAATPLDDSPLTASELANTQAPANITASEGADDSTLPPEAVTTENNTPTIEQVYNPERESGDDQSSMDDIKKRYEDILVIYMFLKKCNRIESTDYNVITSALAQEMASVNAPGRMQFDIVNSAKGSYQEIYSQSACDGAGINKLTRQYHQYIDVLKTNFPPE